MASGALFGNATSRFRSRNLVEFKAGKMVLKGKMCHADKRKGLLYVYQADDSLMHFCWKDRTSGNVDDDLIIFPDDVEFKHVPQCTSGRVYVLRFKSSSRKFIFWMQEAKTDKDDDNCKKVNDALNNPPPPATSNRSGSSLGGLTADLANLTGENDLQSLLGNMSQQQLLQLLGGMGGGAGGLASALNRVSAAARPTSSGSTSSTSGAVDSPDDSAGGLGLGVQSSPVTPVVPRSLVPDGTSQQSVAARPATAAAALPTQTAPAAGSRATPSHLAAAAPQSMSGAMPASAILLSDLQNILSGMKVPAGLPSHSAREINLADSLNAETLIPILADASVQQRLTPFLPPGCGALPSTQEELRATVSSPQFQQALSGFSAALASGQLGPLMGQFGLSDDAQQAANQGDVEAFVKAMQESKADESKADEDAVDKMDEN